MVHAELHLLPAGFPNAWAAHPRSRCRAHGVRSKYAEPQVEGEVLALMDPRVPLGGAPPLLTLHPNGMGAWKNGGNDASRKKNRRSTIMTQAPVAPRDLFAPILNPASRANPYPLYEQLRQTPVAQLDEQ